MTFLYSHQYRPKWGGVSRMTEHRWEKAGKIPPAKYINGRRVRSEIEVNEISEKLLEGVKSEREVAA